MAESLISAVLHDSVATAQPLISKFVVHFRSTDLVALVTYITLHQKADNGGSEIKLDFQFPIGAHGVTYHSPSTLACAMRAVHYGTPDQIKYDLNGWSELRYRCGDALVPLQNLFSRDIRSGLVALQPSAVAEALAGVTSTAAIAPPVFAPTRSSPRGAAHPASALHQTLERMRSLEGRLLVHFRQTDTVGRIVHIGVRESGPDKQDCRLDVHVEFPVGSETIYTSASHAGCVMRGAALGVPVMMNWVNGFLDLRYRSAGSGKLVPLQTLLTREVRAGETVVSAEAVADVVLAALPHDGSGSASASRKHKRPADTGRPVLTVGAARVSRPVASGIMDETRPLLPRKRVADVPPLPARRAALRPRLSKASAVSPHESDLSAPSDGDSDSDTGDSSEGESEHGSDSDTEDGLDGRGVPSVAVVLSQYFTNPAVAKRLVRTVLPPFLPLPWSRYTFVEPSAGRGAFYRCLPPSRRVGVEVDTALRRDFPDYVYCDLKQGGFLGLSADDLGLSAVPSSRVVVLGNPPFRNAAALLTHGRRGGGLNEALRFLNHAAQFADTVAFVVGANFCRPSVQDRVDLELHLVHEERLPLDSFRLNRLSDDDSDDASGGKPAIRAVFQVWQRRYDPRTQQPLLRTKHCHSGARMVRATGRWVYEDGRPGDFEVVLPTDVRCNVAVLRWAGPKDVGRVVTGRAKLTALVQAAQRSQAARRSSGSGSSSSRYGSASYRIGRGSAVHLHLLAKRPAAVAATLRAAESLFAEFCSHVTTGTNPSINSSDLVRIYVQQQSLNS